MDFLAFLVVLAVPFVVAFVVAFAVGFLLGKTKRAMILASVGILVAPSVLISFIIFEDPGYMGISEGLNIWSILFFSIVNIFNLSWLLGAICGLVVGSILSEC